MGSSDQAERNLEHLVDTVTQRTSGQTGPALFESLVRNLAEVLPADVVLAAEVKPESGRAVTLASFAAANGGPPEGIPKEFDLAGTPFQSVGSRPSELFSHPTDAAHLFPNDPILQKIPGNGYIGAPLLDAAGNLLGLMSAVTLDRLEDAPSAEEVVSIFSGLASKELERTRQTQLSERQNSEARRMEEGNALKSQPERDSAYLRDEIRISHPAPIGESPEFRSLMNQVRRAASTSAIVLVDGETGTGKETVARAIHNQSSRRARPVVKLDCINTPAELLEVELFGGLRDPQSEAAPRIGRLDFADGGTLLIDEVAEMPLDLQAKLLRVIQQREFRPLGFPRTAKVDIRIIATTNRDLDQAVRDGRFRSDLHQRLLVDPVHVPPLRRRRQDIPLLTERYLTRLAHQLGRESLRVSERMMSQMMTYSWPGNIRELWHLLYRAALTGKNELDVPVHSVESTWPEPATLEDANRHHVNRTLGACNWVIEGPRGAAAVLGIPPSTLRSLMKRLNIHRAAKPGAA